MHLPLVFDVDSGLIGQRPRQLRDLLLQIRHQGLHLLHLGRRGGEFQASLALSDRETILPVAVGDLGQLPRPLPVDGELLFLLGDDADETGHEFIPLHRLCHPSFSNYNHSFRLAPPTANRRPCNISQSFRLDPKGSVRDFIFSYKAEYRMKLSRTDNVKQL
jgi:hypothetical protein